jgi:hypothetical protein
MYVMTKIAHRQRQHERDNAVSERTDEKLTLVARGTAEAGADVAREGARLAQRATDAAEGVYERTRQLAEDSPEFGRAFAELLGEQTRESVDTLSAFARAVNWTEVAQAQSKLIAGSLLRISQFNAQYGQFLIRGMTASRTLPRR